MQFSLQSLMLLFVFCAAALGAFGWGGFVVIAMVGWAIYAWYSRFGIMSIAAISLIFLILVALSRPAISQSREAVRRRVCQSNLQLIATALNEYRNIHGRYPPAAIEGPDGRPWHSWRVMLLPYLDRYDLYGQYRFDEPWDGPNNIRLLKQMPRVLKCPSSVVDGSKTSYVAFTGDGTPWRNVDDGLSIVIDDPQNTILIGETARDDIPWTAPRDVAISDAAQFLPNSPDQRHLSSRHPGTVQVATVDGAVWQLILSRETPLPDSVYKATNSNDWFSLGSSGEIITMPPDRDWHWPHTVAAIICAAAAIVLIRRSALAGKQRAAALSSTV